MFVSAATLGLPYKPHCVYSDKDTRELGNNDNKRPFFNFGILCTRCARIRMAGTTRAAVWSECEGKSWVQRVKRLARLSRNFCLISRLGNRGDRVSVFGFKSCVFLAVCGQIWQNFLGTYDLRSS